MKLLMGKFITDDETKGRKNIAGDFIYQIKFLGLETTENIAFGILNHASLDLEAISNSNKTNTRRAKNPLTLPKQTK